MKLESDHENLHYEMRTSHLTVDAKLSNLFSQFTVITSETSKVKKKADSLAR